MLVLTLPENLNELFQNRGVASVATLCELCRIVVVAIHTSIMLVITVLGTKDCWAHRTSEMIYVILSVQGSNVGTTECTTALVAKEIQTSKVVRFT
jgi:hypothetical protein